MEQLSGRTKGAIVGMTLAVGVITGGLWVDTPPDQIGTVDASCQHVFAGRGGTLSTCRPKDDKVARNIKKAVGSTATGCVLGALSGGPAGAGYGCLGGLASNIPWAGW